MTDNTARIALAQQAQAALDTFLSPALDAIRADYIDKLAEIAAKPLGANERAAIEKLAMGIKVVDLVHVQIKALVLEGDVASASQTRADQLAELPTERRKWAMM